MSNSATLDSVDEEKADPIHEAMNSVFGDLAASRTGIQSDLAGAPQAMALSYGLDNAMAGSPRESTREKARRILSGAPAPAGDVNLDNAMAVTNLGTSLAAGRAYRMNVAGNIPDAMTPPEQRQNKLDYLNLLTLRGAGDPLANNIEESMGGSTVDERRARVAEMAAQGRAQNITPEERNRRAVIEAMGGSNAGRTPTAEEALLGYAKAGGGGLTGDQLARAIESDRGAAAAKERGERPDATEEFNRGIAAYRDALGKKDYLAARFWAQKLGHKFPDEMDSSKPFDISKLPGYVADSGTLAPANNSAPNSQAPANRTPSAASIAQLKADPKLADQFDKFFGAGASAKVLGEQ